MICEDVFQYDVVKMLNSRHEQGKRKFDRKSWWGKEMLSFAVLYLPIQQRHGDIAVDVASPRAQSRELHGGRRRERRRQGGRLRRELELVAAAEMPHLSRRGRVTAP